MSECAESDQIKVEKIKAPLVIGENNIQKVITKYFSLDHRTIKIRDVNIIINKVETEIFEDKVLVKADIDIKVFYIGIDNLVYYQIVGINFCEFANISGVETDMEVVVNPKIKGIETRLVSEQKIIEQKLDLKFFVKVLSIKELFVNTGKGPLIKIDRIVEQKFIKTILKNEVKPVVSVAKIVSVKAQVKNLKVNMLSNKVVVGGILHKELIYIGDDDDKHSQSEDIPFNRFIDLPDIDSGMKVELNPNIKNIKSNLNPEVNIIKQEFEILLPVIVIEPSQLNLLTGSDSLAMLPEVIGENTEYLLQKVVISLEHPCIEIIELKTNVEVSKSEALTDKVIIEGIINSHVFYVGENNREYNQKTETYFDTLIEVMGARKDMKVDVNITVDYIQKELNSDGNLIQRVVLDCFTKILNQIQFRLFESNLS